MSNVISFQLQLLPWISMEICLPNTLNNLSTISIDSHLNHRHRHTVSCLMVVRTLMETYNTFEFLHCFCYYWISNFGSNGAAMIDQYFHRARNCAMNIWKISLNRQDVVAIHPTARQLAINDPMSCIDEILLYYFWLKYHLWKMVSISTMMLNHDPCLNFSLSDHNSLKQFQLKCCLEQFLRFVTMVTNKNKIVNYAH